MANSCAMPCAKEVRHDTILAMGAAGEVMGVRAQDAPRHGPGRRGIGVRVWDAPCHCPGGRGSGVRTQDAHAMAPEGGRGVGVRTQDAHAMAPEGGRGVGVRTQDAHAMAPEGGRGVGVRTHDIVHRHCASRLEFRGMVPRSGPGPPLPIFPVRAKKRRHHVPAIAMRVWSA
jgi:hypothetical protein